MRTRRRRFLALAGAAALAGCTAPGSDPPPAGPPESRWDRVLGGAGPQLPAAAIEPAGGGYLVAGRDGGQASLTRLAPDGTERWTRGYGGAGPEDAAAVVETGDGAFVFAGSVRVTADRGADALLARVTADGEPEWSRGHGGDGTERARALTRAGDGGYLFAGSTQSFAETRRDAWIGRADPEGRLRWHRNHRIDELDAATALARTADGYVLAGDTRPDPSANKAPWVLGLDGEGRERWRRTFETSTFAGATAAVPAPDGGSAIAGFRGRDAWLLRLAADGRTVWERRYGGDRNEEGTALARTADGGYVLGGITKSFGAGGSNGYLVRTGAEGAVRWTHTVGEDGDESVSDVLQTSDGGYLLVGTKPVQIGSDNSPRIDRDRWVVKLGGQAGTGGGG